MSPNPPIVPSRDALRALYRLAYGGSTIIAAVGSVFTVAGVSYDTQRRVRLAERLIETKRTIRSVSNSNGAAHVARMFEAAERGEDFSLETTRSQKRNTRRDYSALMTEKAQQQPAGGSPPVEMRYPLGEDKISGGVLAEQSSSSQKEWITCLERSTSIPSRSLSSPRSVKGLSSQPPPLSSRRIMQDRSWRTIPYNGTVESWDRGQTMKELPRSGPPSVRRVLVESYPRMRDTVNTTIQRGDRQTRHSARTSDKRGDPSRDSGEGQHGVERILASTQQQHKLRNHGVYGRPGKKLLAQQGREDASTPSHHGPKSNSSAAERLVAATQQQHKLHSHTVYSRPGKVNANVQARLNEYVALWLNTDGLPKSDSELRCDSGMQAGVALGRGNNSKRRGSMFVGNDSNLKPLRRNLSTSAREIDALSGSGSPSSPPSQHKNSQTPVESVQVTRSLTHTCGQDIQISSQEWSRPLQHATDDRGTPCALGTTQPVPAEEQHASTEVKRCPRTERRFHWVSLNYHSYSLFSPKDKPTTVESSQRSASTRREVPSSRQVMAPVALDIQLQPWPESVSGGIDIPKTPIAEKGLPENSHFEDVSVQHSLSSLVNDPSVNDLSGESPTYHVSRPCIQESPSQRWSDASFGSDNAFGQCVTLSRTQGYAVWHEYIYRVIKECGPPAGRNVWLKAMEYYAAPGDSRNWHLVDVLHKHFYKKFWRASPPYYDSDAGRLLTRHVIEVAPTSQRAAELLFPFDGKDVELEAEFLSKGMAYTAVQRSMILFANASRYLMDLWNDGDDNDSVISELRKIVKIAKVQDIELVEGLFFSTIQRLTSNGRIEQAQALFDEMVYYHQVEPSFLTRSILVCGHAKAGDWNRVAKEIEAMHNVHDLSRREPLGYSLMFNDVLVEYASRRSVAQTHDFLVHALGYWGLVPTSAISATAIQAFLVDRRFDLVREWIETVRILFPQVDTETSRFAWHLGSVWEDINASCVEVEEACRALCYQKDASKVQLSLREMVRLALARDIATKLHAAEVAETGRKGNDNFPADSIWALNHLLERAQSFASTTSADGESQAIESPEARELLVQVESVARLDKLFSTKGKFTDPTSIDIQGSSQSRNPQNRAGPAHAASLQSHVPTDLMLDILPILPKLERLMDEYYSIRQKEGLPVSHEILKYTCQKLRKADRRNDVMKLLKATFDSAYVRTPTGVMFDLSVMEMWLRCAYETKSISQCVTVFWAVLDAGEDYVLTSKFFLLAKMTYNRVRQNRFETVSRHNAAKHEELEYLLHKLSRKLWLDYKGAGPAVDKARRAEYRSLKNQTRRRLIVGNERIVEVS